MGGVSEDGKPEKHVPQTLQSSLLLLCAAGAALRSRSHRSIPPHVPRSGDHFTCFYLSGESLLDRRRTRVPVWDGCCGENRPGEPAGEKQPHGVHRQQRSVCLGRLPGKNRRCVVRTCAGKSADKQAFYLNFHRLFLFWELHMSASIHLMFFLCVVTR